VEVAGYVNYSGFWRRFAAALIDGILLGIVGSILGRILDPAISLPVTIVIDWVYFAGLESSSGQATLGKRALGIIVTDLAGQRISFLRATGRYFAKFISAVIFLIGYLMQPFTAKKQALHDIIAGTLVLRT
jgi:uncharacterized RDD family membrane protein YckC